jgi:hypothetical protein
MDNSYKEFWWAEVTEACLEDQDCHDYTYQWILLKYVPGWWLPYMTTLGYGNQIWVNIPYVDSHHNIVYLLVLDCNNIPIYGDWKYLEGWDASGNCLTYKTASTGIKEITSNVGAQIIPNPNPGTFTVKSKILFSSQSLITVLDMFGHDLSQQFSTSLVAKNQLQLVAKSNVSRGLYIIKVVTGSES